MAFIYTPSVLPDQIQLQKILSMITATTPILVADKEKGVLDILLKTESLNAASQRGMCEAITSLQNVAPGEANLIYGVQASDVVVAVGHKTYIYRTYTAMAAIADFAEGFLDQPTCEQSKAA